MKNILFSLVLLFSSVVSVSAAVEDTSIVDELEKNNVIELQSNFKLQSFETCDNLENVLETYIKDYWKSNKNRNYPAPFYNL